MLGVLLTTVIVVTATVAVHAFGTVYWVRHLVRRYVDPSCDFRARAALPALALTTVVLLMLHLVEVVIWALAYVLILPGDQLASFEQAVYFSAVTFTTLGYGDITLIDHDWRIRSGI